MSSAADTGHDVDQASVHVCFNQKPGSSGSTRASTGYSGNSAYAIESEKGFRVSATADVISSKAMQIFSSLRRASRGQI